MIGLREEFSGIHIQSFYKNYHLPQFNLTEKLGDGCEIIIPDFIIQEEAKGNYYVADFANDEEKIRSGIAVPGQVHFFPAVCNAEQLRAEFQRRNVKTIV